MKSKQLIVLAAILVVGIGVTIYTINKRSGQITTGGESAGEAVLKDFKAADISSFSINDGTNTVTVDLKDGKWVVPARDGFPASLTAVNELRDNAYAMRIAEVQKVGESQLGRLKLKEPADSVKEEERGTLVSFNGDGGKEMASVIIGKKLEDKQPENFMSMSPQGPKAQYVKVKGIEGTVYQAKDGFSKLEADPKGWLDKEKFFKVEKLKSITVTGPTPEESWKISRETDGGALKLEDAKEGEEFDPAKASAQGSAFSYPSFDDILPAAEKDKAALDKPTHTAVLTTFEGLTYTVKVGAKVPPPPPPAVTDPATPPPTPPDAHYVSFTVEGQYDENPPPYTTPAPVAPTAPAEPAADASEEDKKKHEEAKKTHETAVKNHETAMKTWEEGKKKAEETFKTELVKKKEKLAAEQTLQPRIFVMQKYTVEPVMKKRSEFMKDKVTTPAEGTTAATPGSATTPAISADAIVPKVNPGPTPPKSSGKIEAVTPPIEVIIPPKDGDKKEEPKKPADPKKPAEKKDTKKKPK